ncbi:MAG: Cna B-type domain-containing protein, partial [Firmicutes bacterium]|nr:Cna B-type domain-containing protein [Bacillota bacterium]
VTTLKNSYTPETTSATVKKAWDDKDNQDGKRPGSLTVNLMNGSTKVDSVTLSDKNNWTDTISNLPKYANGREITYTWVEESVSGYTAADPVTENGVTTLKNTYNPGKVSVPVTKVWNDNNNQDNKRPTTIDVELLANNEATNKHLILSAANNWKGAFSDLDEYKNGTKITYTVKELTVTDYKSEITEDPQNAGGFIITNTHTPETTKVKVTKTWSDSNNQDGKRASVNATVQLYQTVDGTKTAVGDPVSVGSADNWSKTWENLPVNKGGKQITYSVEETLSANSSYTKSGDDTTLPAVKGDSGTIAITNSYTPETTKVTVTKTWNDSNNQDGKRSSVGATVQLYKTVGETKTAVGTAEPVGTADDWSKTWNDLPTHENGTEITYTVEETLPENSVYTSAISGSAAKGFTITNSYTPETVDVSVKKVWDDANNQDGKRPESLTVNLMNGSTKVDSVTLSDKNNWTDTIDNLPKYADGKEITYTWEEAKLPEGYSLTSSEKDLKDATLTVITNGYKPGTTSVTIKKIWDDENDQDGKRSGVVATVQLYKTVESIKAAVGDPVEVGTDNNWSKTWNDLPTHEGGKPISYSVAETLTTSNGYAIDGTAEVAIANGGTGTITNKNTPEVTSITVNKTWDDNNDQDGKRSGVVAKVTLKKTVGEATTDVETVTVGAADNWSKKWENLPVYEGGKKITYSVVETLETANGYTSDTTEAVTVANGGSKTIKNSYTPGETSITVTKKWDDKNNQDGKRSGVVAKVTLKKTVNGTTTDVETVTVGAADNWSKKWEKLPTHAGGKEITYSVVETLETANGYTSDTTEAVTVANGGSKVITNTYAPKETSIKVTKNWADSGNQDGKRPSNATVQLYKTVGETKTAVGAAITVGAEKDAWNYTWKNLPVYENGTAIKYSVTETLPDGTEYTKSGDDVTWTAAEGETKEILITNSYTPEKTTVTVTKTWDDNNDQDGKRSSVNATVQLYKTVGETKTAVGDPVSIEIVPATDEGATTLWAYEWGELPVYENGTKIVYSVEETLPEGSVYTKSGDDTTLTAKKGSSGIIDITNSYTPESTKVTVEKTWDDASNQDGKRPSNATVQLYKTVGETKTAVGAAITVGAEKDAWTYTWVSLPVYEDGSVITYSVEETLPDGTEYTKSGDDTTLQAKVTDSGTITITNSYTPETTKITVNKTWGDNSDQDGKRPADATVQLYKTVGETKTAVGDPVTVGSKENTWTNVWEKLPVYENGTKIVYSVEETLPEGASYTKKGDEVTLTAVKDDSGTIKITNTHEIEKTSVRGRKFWADEDDLDGIRPETITVNLLADGTKVDSVAVTPDEQGNWTYAFTNLDKYEPGKVGHKIEYSVTEDEIALVEGHPTGYTATYSEQGYDITNKHEPETIEIPVTKTWDDYENRYNTRPESITIRLLADGEEIDVVTLTAPAAAEVDEAGEVIAKPVAEDAAAEDGNTWTYTFTELPRYKKVEGEGSVEIEYSVTEDEVARYRTEIAAEPVFSEDGREEILVDITNTYRRPHKPTPPDEPIPPDDPDTPDEPIDDPDTPLTPPDGPNPPEPGFDEDEYLDDGDTPLSGYEEEEELDEEDVPLSPFTGDDRRTNAWAGVSLASLVGIAILARRRREEEE